MGVQKDIERKRKAMLAQAERLQREVERLDRLWPLVGESAAVVGDSFEDLMDVVEVGDEVFSKYGQQGVITRIENIDAANWYEVVIHYRDTETGAEYQHAASRMNYLHGLSVGD